MQVESLPASSVIPVPETVQPAAPPTPPSEPISVPQSTVSEESEQQTFHVMQPPQRTPQPPPSTEPAETETSAALTPLVPVPIASEQPIVPNTTTTTTPATTTLTTTTPTPVPTSAPTTKQTKRGSRASQNHKPIHRSPGKPPLLLAKPSTGKPSPILPQPQKPVLVSNQMAPLVPKPITTNGQIVKPSSTNQSAGFTTYLVVDGNQGQLVQVANDGPKPVTFRNQAGQILQATPITVVSTGNQSTAPTFPTNGDSSVCNISQLNNFQQQQPQQTGITAHATQNSSQTVTTVRTSSSIDTTTMTTQQITGITQIPANTSLLNGCNILPHQPSLLQPTPILPTSLLNGNSVATHDRDMSPVNNDNDSSLDETLDSSIADPNQSLSLSQLAVKANHRHRRSSSSSLSKKKRGRPRLYERDPFTNKPIKSRPMPEGTELTLPTIANANNPPTLLMPGPTSTTFTNLMPSTNTCTSLIFPNQTSTITVATANPSLLQQQPYTYPSLLNGNASSTNMLTAPTLNIFANNNNFNASNLSSSPYSYPPQTTTTTTTTILPPPSQPTLAPPPSIPQVSAPIQSSQSMTTANQLSRSTFTPMTQTVENQATIPLKNLQISSTSSPTTSSPRPSSSSTTTIPSVVQLNSSPIKAFNQTLNNDVVVHYIGGFVIRESSQPFPIEDHDEQNKDFHLTNGKEKENHSFNDNNSDLGSDQLRCISCKKVDFSERFYNQDKRVCSKVCSTKSSKSNKMTNGKKHQHDQTPPITEATRKIESSFQQSAPTSVPMEYDEPVQMPPDHGLPHDPSKWTVSQVGEFIARLTNDTIRETFYESEMDGQALLLMTQEHLRDTMKIKLGPSLVISSEIAKLRERSRTFSS